MPNKPVHRVAKSARPLRVLVVDNDKGLADNLVEILRTQNYDASAFYNAAEAKDWCRDRCPFAVITEAMMGPTSGVQLAVHLARRFPECKLLMLSGHAQVCKRLSESKGFDNHFTIFAKPVDPQRILDFLASPKHEHARRRVPDQSAKGLDFVICSEHVRPSPRLAPASEAAPTHSQKSR